MSLKFTCIECSNTTALLKIDGDEDLVTECLSCGHIEPVSLDFTLVPKSILGESITGAEIKFKGILIHTPELDEMASKFRDRHSKLKNEMSEDDKGRS